MTTLSTQKFTEFLDIPGVRDALRYSPSDDDYRRPTPATENMKRIGARDSRNFVDAGTRLARVVRAIYRHEELDLTEKTRILDWGCGAGRVTLPFSRLEKVALYACDVDSSAVSFVQRNAPEVNAFVSAYDPPLPFMDGFFDGLYSFSVFSHLPQDAEAAWLSELSRICRPGATLLVSVVGRRSLENHHRHGNDLDLKWSDAEREGFVFSSNPLHQSNRGRWPGVTGDYGIAVHHPEYIMSAWAKYFSRIEIVEAATGGQDVVVCTR